MNIAITITAVIIAIIALLLARDEARENAVLRAAVDPDDDIFATLLARNWSIYYVGGTWSIGNERAATPAEAWRRAVAVHDARSAGADQDSKENG